jgi:hypothetical protein
MLGTKYDLLKGRDNKFKYQYFEHQRKFILNCRYTSLLGS